jgi:hypothetical protein
MGISQQIGASSMVKWGVCTSTTRPASPYHGQHIYETDTNFQYVWNGSAWVNNYASSASPTFTGVPAAPTATAGTSTTQIATTAFVTTANNLKANIASPVFTGTVINPTQPAFSAYPAVNYGLASTNIIYHTATLFNVGGHFNTSNYRFTAPAMGVYHFSLNLNVYNLDTGNYFMPALYKNGNGLHYGDRQNGLGATDINANVSASIYLQTGDYVQPYCISNDGAYNISGNHVWNSFTGVLVW